MAQRKPSFVTGANAKIKVGGKTFAYASDVAYTISVDTIPIETMGRYEAVTNEPVNYTVNGSLTVVRYTKIAGQAGMPSPETRGNGLGNATFATGGVASDHFNPGNMLLSQTWDLQVYQKTQSSPTTGGDTSVAATEESVEFITISDCRFNRKSATITKRGILQDSLGFVGILAGDDSFKASHSGDKDFSV